MSKKIKQINLKTVEMLGYSYPSNQGYTIFVSLVESAAYDFVVEKDGNYKKINVKVVGLKSKINPNSWSISVSSGSSIRFRNTLDVLNAKGAVDVYFWYGCPTKIRLSNYRVTFLMAQDQRAR